MCMELLGRLATSELPLTEANPAVIDRLRVLEAAGHIRVLIPPAHFDCDDCLRQDAVTVFEILPAGWKALSVGAPDEMLRRFHRHGHGAPNSLASPPGSAAPGLDLANEVLSHRRRGRGQCRGAASEAEPANCLLAYRLPNEVRRPA